MKQLILICAALSLLAGCGGNRSSKSFAPAVSFASGPIQKACQAQKRKASSRARCGCIQAVANQSLSDRDQRRGAKYFKNPGKLQEVRQSDAAGNERFWKAWKAFGQTAAAICKDT